MDITGYVGQRDVERKKICHKMFGNVGKESYLCKEKREYG